MIHPGSEAVRTVVASSSLSPREINQITVLLLTLGFAAALLHAPELAAYLVLVNSMTEDLVDYDESLNGRHRDCHRVEAGPLIGGCSRPDAFLGRPQLRRLRSTTSAVRIRENDIGIERPHHLHALPSIHGNPHHAQSGHFQLARVRPRSGRRPRQPIPGFRDRCSNGAWRIPLRRNCR